MWIYSSGYILASIFLYRSRLNISFLRQRFCHFGDWQNELFFVIKNSVKYYVSTSGRFGIGSLPFLCRRINPLSSPPLPPLPNFFEFTTDSSRMLIQLSILIKTDLEYFHRRILQKQFPYEKLLRTRNLVSDEENLHFSSKTLSAHEPSQQNWLAVHPMQHSA